MYYQQLFEHQLNNKKNLIDSQMGSQMRQMRYKHIQNLRRRLMFLCSNKMMSCDSQSRHRHTIRHHHQRIYYKVKLRYCLRRLDQMYQHYQQCKNHHLLNHLKSMYQKWLKQHLYSRQLHHRFRHHQRHPYKNYNKQHHRRHRRQLLLHINYQNQYECQKRRRQIHPYIHLMRRRH